MLLPTVSASRSDRNILPNFCGLSSSSPRKRGGGQFSHGENYYLQRHSHPWTTKIEVRRFSYGTAGMVFYMSFESIGLLALGE